MIYVKDSGTWKTTPGFYAKVNGEWVKKANYIKVAGQWRRVDINVYDQTLEQQPSTVQALVH
jgi:hypothetical protein